MSVAVGARRKKGRSSTARQQRQPRPCQRQQQQRQQQRLRRRQQQQQPRSGMVVQRARTGAVGTGVEGRGCMNNSNTLNPHSYVKRSVSSEMIDS